MQHHPKTYENVFSTDHQDSKTKLKIEKLSAVDMELGEYTSSFHNFLKDFYSNLFLDCVKLSWLRRKFIFCGKKVTLPIYNNSRPLQNAFTKFMRRHIGNDIQIITKGRFFLKLELHYFDKLFPGFDDGNPFENPDYYKFPFDNISMEFLIVVHQMDDRIELLKEADDKKMSYAVFLDYILNYILVENDILGRRKYNMEQNNGRNFPYYVRDLDKILQPKKGSKRR